MPWVPWVPVPAASTPADPTSLHRQAAGAMRLALKGKGVLRIRLLRGEGLKATNDTTHDGEKDASDPYCELTLGGEEERSTTIRGSLNPEWDELFEFRGGAAHFGSHAAHNVSHAAHELGHSVSHAAHEAGHGVSHAAHNASHAAHEMGHGVSHAAHNVSHSHAAHNVSHSGGSVRARLGGSVRARFTRQKPPSALDAISPTSGQRAKSSEDVSDAKQKLTQAERPR